MLTTHTGKNTINSGEEIHDVKEIIKVTEQYYTELYSTKQELSRETLKQIEIKIENVNSEMQSEINKTGKKGH